jgi:hypothetical protein
MAKKKAPAAKAAVKTSAKTKKAASPRSNVNVLPRSPKVSNKQYIKY